MLKQLFVRYIIFNNILYPITISIAYFSSLFSEINLATEK